MTDAAEALCNSLAGLLVSLALVWALRASGLWDAHMMFVGCVFFAASWVRSFAIRRAFRWLA